MSARRDSGSRRAWWPGHQANGLGLDYGAAPSEQRDRPLGPPADKAPPRAESRRERAGVLEGPDGVRYIQVPVDQPELAPEARPAGSPASEGAPNVVATLKCGVRRGQPAGADGDLGAAVPAVTGDVVAWPAAAGSTAELDDQRAGASSPVPVEGGATVVPFPGGGSGGLVPAGTDDEDRPTGATADGGADAEGGSVVRVRGWAGRGPVGLVSVKPPKWVKERAGRRTGLGWRVWRLVSGAEWDGRARTNATWFRCGTKAWEWSDRLPPRVAAWPRVARAAARWVVAAAVGLTGWLGLEAPTPTAWAVGASASLVLGASGWAAVDSLLGWPHRRRRVWPLHQALAPKLGYPERTPPRRYLFVPRNYALAGGQVEVALPPDFVSDGSDERGKQVANIVRRKLALADVSEVWRLDFRNHFLILRPTFRPPVPAWVRFSDPTVRAVVGALGESELLIGLAAGGEPVTFDLDTESPHAALLFGSGGGKSECLKSLGSQGMNRGGEVWIFDYKYTSHDGWVTGLERRGLVRVFRSIEEIHRGLVALGAECQRRNEAARAASAAGRPKPTFRRLMVLLDEAAITVQLLKLWWATHRREIDPDEYAVYGNPAWTKSPAVVGAFMALSMGRERLVNVALVSQVANANEIGGSAIRAMFHLRILGRQPMSAWRMVAPEVDSPPVCSRRQGRIYPVIEGKVIETQGLYFTDPEAAEWAAAGHPVDSQPRDLAHTFVSRADGREVANDSRATAAVETPQVLVTLAQASADKGSEVVPYTHQTLRNYSGTDPTFPDPAKRATRRGKPHLYDSHQLAQWHADRTGIEEDPQP